MNAKQRKSEALHVARKDKEEADDSLEVVTGMGIPKGDGSVGTLLKARDKEMTMLENELTDLRMQNHYLKVELAKKNKEVRRLSQQHGFYDFGDDDGSRRSSRASVELMNDENVKRLESQVAALEDALKESRMECSAAKAAQERAESEYRRKKELNMELEKDMDNLHAEKMMLQGDREVLKAQVKMLSDETSDLASRLRAAEAKAGGSSKRLDEHVERERSRVRDAEKRAARFRDAASMLENSVTRAEAQCEELRMRARATHGELVEERRVRAELETEVKVLRDRLREEARRVDLVNEAREHKCLSHAGRGPCPDKFRRPPMEHLEELLRNTNVTRDYVNLKHDNLGQWRDTVLAEINDSLKLLYCFQRQVEMQRDEFVQEYARHERFQDITNFAEKENGNYTRNAQVADTTLRTETRTNEKNEVKRTGQQRSRDHRPRRSPRTRNTPVSSARPPIPTPSHSSVRRMTGRKGSPA